MEQGEEGIGSRVIKTENICRINLFVEGRNFLGDWVSGTDYFTACDAEGNQISVQVRERSGEEETKENDPAELFPGQYPHLWGIRRVIRDGSREFICRDIEGRISHEPVEAVLSGGGMNLQQRILLSLSLAAAAAELEKVFDQIPVRQLRLDAFLMDRETCRVKIDCMRLGEGYSAEETMREYGRMGKLGFMPPQWYEDPAFNPADLQGMRHLLAVLLFRVLCTSDPFDGAFTLSRYPFRSRKTLPEIYGRNAAYILKTSGESWPNRPNSYIGERALMIFGRICPALKQLFETAFVDGIADPDLRPTALQWLENQKNMVNWYCNAGQNWRVPDLNGGKGVLKGVPYLCMDNGVILPILQDKPVCRYMFEKAGEPLNETAAGFFRVRAYGAELVLDGRTFPLNMRGDRMEINGMGARVRMRPWEWVEPKEKDGDC